MKHIPIAGPSISTKEIDYVTDAVQNAWFNQHDIYHKKFEAAFAEYINVRYAISLPSCTSAIHLSLAALGIGPGDEVIVPESTWIASAAPITYVGATPIFADIDEKNWCLTAESIKTHITSRTKAVIPVNLYGNMPEYDEIQKIAETNNINIIEDAAQSIGSEYKGKCSGSLGNIGVFSFHGSKTMTTGEGGMLVTDDTDLFHKINKLRDHGRASGSKQFWNDEIAYKYKMSSLQAALGLAQLERIEELIDKKVQIFNWYEKYLGNNNQHTINYQTPGTKSTYWMVTVILSPGKNLFKEEVMERLNRKRIATRPFFYPLSSLPAFQYLEQTKTTSKENPISYKLSPYGLNLPSALNLTEEMVQYVCESFLEIVEN